MANTFRVLTFAAEPASTSAGSEYHIYTAPSSTTTVVIGLILTNIHTSQVTTKVLLESDTSGDATASSTQTNNIGAKTGSGSSNDNSSDSNSNTLKMVKLVVAVMMIAHVAACIFFSIASIAHLKVGVV